MTRHTVWRAAMILICAVVGFGIAGQAGAVAALLTAAIVALIPFFAPGPAVQLVPVRVRDNGRRRREPF